MIDVIGTLMWICLGAGVLALAFAEYKFVSKKQFKQ
jgi:hypothetical protein